MASHSFSIPSSPDPLDAISKSRWDETFDDALSPNGLATGSTEGELDFDPEGPMQDTLSGDDGWNFMDHNLPWLPWEDLLEDVPSALKEPESLPSTHSGFGRDVGNLPQTAPSSINPLASDVDASPFPVEDDARPTPGAQSEDEDDSDFFDDFDEDMEDLVVFYDSRQKYDEVVEVPEDDVEAEDDVENDDDDDDDEVNENDADNEDAEVSDGGREDNDEDSDADNEDEDEDEVYNHAFVNDGIATLGVEDVKGPLVTREDEAVVRRSGSPSAHAVPDVVQDIGGDDGTVVVADPAPAAQPSRGGKGGTKTSFTFPPSEDLTLEEMKAWSKEEKSAFLLQRCAIDPDVVVECEVPGPDGRPCGARFSRLEIRMVRRHFVGAHVLEPKDSKEQKTPKRPKGKRKTPKAQKATETEKATKKRVVCPWPGCEETCAFAAVGRHVAQAHWGLTHQCPFCPCAPIPRSDSIFRHMEGHFEERQCQDLPATSRTSSPARAARGEASGQPEAELSTQQRQPTRACAEPKKPQARARAALKQPAAGPSQRKRSRRCVEEEEFAPEEGVESDDDDGNDSDWVPTKSDRKGKGKGPARKRRRR
ncbi:hypothetical protein GSI_10481 [Ganoderma sinense ZZ0214-1]|uniref:Uncharacterized protein n=1 Tax=Ganoderma sinense ZZ0214-1 TaxID=1077348 RepID=A0A2G8S0S2_9APHY|nr:hypothetical protein GSI_10481 [Ganoderma sinense ZZ0214-1]